MGLVRIDTESSEVLRINIGPLDDLVGARLPRTLPVVLRVREVSAVLDQLDGVNRLFATLLDGADLRLLECARQRVNAPLKEIQRQNV